MRPLFPVPPHPRLRNGNRTAPQSARRAPRGWRLAAPRRPPHLLRIIITTTGTICKKSCTIFRQRNKNIILCTSRAEKMKNYPVLQRIWGGNLQVILQNRKRPRLADNIMIARANHYYANGSAVPPKSPTSLTVICAPPPLSGRSVSAAPSQS